jgi:hypothetical protein
MFVSAVFGAVTNIGPMDTKGLDGHVDAAPAGNSSKEKGL